jgi:hypothetical protein
MKRREKPTSPEIDNDEVVIVDPTMILIRFKQLGDRGLQAAMRALATKDSQE